MSDHATRHGAAGKTFRRARTIEEAELDEILSDSFPASDPPPWTLGVSKKKPEALPDESRRVSRSDSSLWP